MLAGFRSSLPTLHLLLSAFSFLPRATTLVAICLSEGFDVHWLKHYDSRYAAGR